MCGDDIATVTVMVSNSDNNQAVAWTKGLQQDDLRRSLLNLHILSCWHILQIEDRILWDLEMELNFHYNPYNIIGKINNNELCNIIDLYCRHATMWLLW